jgi:dipeptidyl aminopeptidase/acylaminoacyl peptidase
MQGILKTGCLVAAILSGPVLSAQRLVTLDDFLNGERVSGVELSHDGNYVLEHFTVTDGPKTTRYSLVKSLPGLDSLARFDSVRVEWMPVTEALLLHQGDSLVRIDPGSGVRTVIARNLPKKSRIEMAPTEDYLVLSRTKEGPKEDPDVFRILEPEDRQPGWRDRTYLVKWDLATGDTLVLAKSRYNSYLEDISADGRKLLISSPRSRLEKRPTTVEDVVVMDAVTGKADTLLRAAPFLETKCFSPDGKQLLVRASPEAFDRIGEHIRSGQTSSMIFQVLYRLDIATGKVVPLTDRIPQSVHNFVWSKDDNQVYFMAEDRDYQSLYTLNPKTAKVRQLDAAEEMITGFSVARGKVAYVGEGVSNSMRCWLLEKGKNTLLEDSSAKLLEGIDLGEVHDWNYTHSRGETIYGRYYLPPHFDPSKKYPMIVNYYGGCSPTGRNFESRYPHHLYAAQGYVVYIVQPSGATGFGQEFAARHVNTWGEGGAEDIIEGVEKFCAAHPFVDKSRIGCIGASFGGFMSQYLVMKTDIFAAAISHAGISDITSYWGEGYWGYSYCEVSTANNYPWEARAQEMILSQSPLFNADKVNTPILFLHGMADTNVPVGESIQMFTALKLLGKDTAFVAVKDQNHHILDYAKRQKWQKTIFAWFAKYLQDDPSQWDALYPPVEL